MRPPRPPILTFYKPQNPFFLTPHPRHHARLSSTTPTPTLSLLKTHNIPAPHTGHIRVLSLNNPRTRNAISRQLLSELSHEIDALKAEADDEVARRASEDGAAAAGVGQGTRALIIASEVDECFCAGADLKERMGMSKEQTRSFLTALRATLTTLSTLPIPSIAAIHSHAHGGGLELALSCTFRLLSSTALISLPETRLAIIPGAGGTYRLRKLIGYTRALEMILTGRRVSGNEAKEMGICERVVDVGYREGGREVRGRVFESAVGMAGEICEGGPRGVGAVMRAVGEGTAGAEEREYEGVVGMGDRDEALRAFGEKRRAVFRGR